MRLIEQPSELKFAYEDGADVADALEAVATKVYRADGVDFTPAAKRQLAELRENGFGNLPVCVAKTQYSFSDNAKAVSYTHLDVYKRQALTRSGGAARADARAAPSSLPVMCSFAMPWMVRLPLGIRTIENIGTSAKELSLIHILHRPW